MLAAIIHSLYDAPWLKARKNKLGAAFKYAALLLLFTLALYVVPLVFTRPQEFIKIKNQIITEVPPFQATVRQGELTITGPAQPYRWVSPDQRFVFVVDTKATTSPGLESMLAPGQSGLLITRQLSQIYDAARGSDNIQYWRNAPDGSLNKDELVAGINRLTSPRVLIPLGLLTFLLVYAGFFISKLISLLVVGLVCLVFSAAGRRGWRFKELFAVGLYALTFPTLVSFILFWLGVNIAWLHFLVLLAFLLAVVLTKDTTPAAETPAASPPNPPRAP